MENYSLSDVASVIGNNGQFGNCGSSWVIILFLFFLMSGNGFWNNNRNNCATNSDMQDAFNFASLERQMNEGRAETIASEGNLATLIKDVGYNNLANLKETESLLQNVQYQISNCCCETNRNIDNVRYENSKNTCDITNAIHCEGEKTRALINDNTIQKLRDKVQELSFAQSQCCQNQYLTNTLRPYPNPAYIVCSPYGTSCGCGSPFSFGNGYAYGTTF